MFFSDDDDKNDEEDRYIYNYVQFLKFRKDQISIKQREEEKKRGNFFLPLYSLQFSKQKTISNMKN